MKTHQGNSGMEPRIGDQMEYDMTGRPVQEVPDTSQAEHSAKFTTGQIILFAFAIFAAIGFVVVDPFGWNDQPAAQQSSGISSRIEMGKRMIADKLEHPSGLTFGRTIEANVFTVDNQGDSHEGKAVCYEFSFLDGKGWAALSPANNLYFANGADNSEGWERFCGSAWRLNGLQ
jgi:hypothetical protein